MANIAVISAETDCDTTHLHVEFLGAFNTYNEAQKVYKESVEAQRGHWETKREYKTRTRECTTFKKMYRGTYRLMRIAIVFKEI